MKARTLTLIKTAPRFDVSLRKDGARNTLSLFASPRHRALVTAWRDMIGTATPSPSLMSAMTLVGTASLIAPSDMAAGRAVITLDGKTCVYADHRNFDHAGKLVGVTVAPAAAGQFAQINTGVTHSVETWSWDPMKDIWLSSNGMLTQTPDETVAFVQRVGYAIDETTIRVVIADPIYL